MCFHDNQTQTAEQVIAEFQRGKPFVVLNAQMQSGKTGTYNFTCFRMIEHCIVNQVYIICGSADKSLRAQAHQDLKVGIREYVNHHSTAVNQQDLFDKLNRKIKIFFSQDLRRLNSVPHHTLIVHEESHMAQSKSNRPFKLYERLGLSQALSHNFEALLSKNIYILGVSATPFSEITVNTHLHQGTLNCPQGVDSELLHSKHVMNMTPGEGYIGIPDFVRNGNFRFTASPVHKSPHFGKVLDDHMNDAIARYIIVRTARTSDEDMIRSMCVRRGYDYIPHMSESDTRDMSFLDTPPEKMTVVHICGRARMGEVVPKRHVIAVYESSEKPKTDTILQGLPGRMCGYTAGGAHLEIEIYVSPKAQEGIETYAKAWREGNPRRLTEINHANNLTTSVHRSSQLKVTDSEGKDWIATVPIHIPRSHFPRKPQLQEIRQLFENHPELIRSNPDKQSILNLIDSEINRSRSQKYRYHKLVSSLYKGVHNAYDSNMRKSISDMRLEFERKPQHHRYCFKLVHNGPGSDYYLVALIPYVSDVHDSEIERQGLSDVSPDCNYMPFQATNEDGSVEVTNGGQAIHFPPETSTDPEEFVEELTKAIQRTQPEDPSYIHGCSPSIHTMYDLDSRLYKGLRFEMSAYPEGVFEDAIQRVERATGVNVSCNFRRRYRNKGYFRFKSLSW
uniref:Helicase/UvrB N-terminal domain-containing protein n=1 Tax=viral metagenome TaxID=1070528 RepID=A0A6C0F9Q4_9ZZZZ|tara:strand:- start:8093 stop:10117 length:2025 start_codon:yes stop_codon:yes gene_type:complete